MPYATTHILVAIILIELFRSVFIKDNKKFPRYYILIAAIGGMIPDLDIAAYYVLYFFGFTLEQVHRTFLHTIFVPLILLIIGFGILIFKIKSAEFGKRHITLHTTFFILSIMSFVHLALDLIFTGAIIPLYPFSNFAMDMNIVRFFPIGLQKLIEPTLDGLLLLFWIFWMEFKLKITDYF